MNNQNNEEWKEELKKEIVSGEIISIEKVTVKSGKLVDFISTQLSKAEKRGEMRGLERAFKIINEAPVDGIVSAIEQEIKKLQ